MTAPLMGLGCGCCGPSSCTARINVIMSDNMPMDDSGITITLVVKDEADNVVLSEGPSSPGLSAVQYTHAATAGETYTAELTVKQDGGPDCTFTREFTAPAVCDRPFSVSLFIPRVWVRFSYCNQACTPYASCEMPISVSGPDSFAASGTTLPYPDPPPVFLGDIPRDLCRFKFTPCSEGEYTIVGTTTVPHTDNGEWVLDVDWHDFTGDFLATERPYFVDGGGVINPSVGYQWPGGCEAPVSSTLSMSSTVFGSGTLEAVGDGTCSHDWKGGSSGSILDCGGGMTSVGVSWGLQRTSYGWRLAGTIPNACICCIPDAYGVPRPTLVAGGPHTVYVQGEIPMGPGCLDCEALDLSIPVAFAGWGYNPSPGNFPYFSLCPDQEVGCAGPSNSVRWHLFSDTITITP